MLYCVHILRSDGDDMLAFVPGGIGGTLPVAHIYISRMRMAGWNVPVCSKYLVSGGVVLRPHWGITRIEISFPAGTSVSRPGDMSMARVGS